MSENAKSWLLHGLVGAALGLLPCGPMFVFALFLGIELSQAMYRSFGHGYRWSDLYRQPLIVLRYLPAYKGGWVDTVMDVLVPVCAATLVHLLVWG